MIKACCGKIFYNDWGMLWKILSFLFYGDEYLYQNLPVQISLLRALIKL